MFVYVHGLACPVALQNDMASRAAASHCAGLHTCDRLPLFRARAVTLQEVISARLCSTTQGLHTTVALGGLGILDVV